MIPSARTSLVAALAAASFATLSSAQTIWDNEAGTGVWGTNTNWAGNTLPGTGTAVLFNDTATPGSVSLGNTTREVSTLEFGNTAGAYDITGGGASGQLRANTLLNSSSSGTGNVISSRVHSRGTGTANTLAFTGTGAATLTLSGAIQDQSGTRATRLNKTSTGVLVFSGTVANTFTGTTTLSDGRLELAKTAGLDAISGSTLTISGGEVRLINANQIINTAAVSLSGGHLNLNNNAETLGSLAVSGASTLSLGTGALIVNAATTFASGQTLNLGISNLASFGSVDTGANTLVFGGVLNVTGTHSFANGDSFDLFNGSISGTFSTVNLPTLSGGLEWDTSALYTDGIIAVSAIPEPSALAALAGLGALGFVGSRRRRRA